MYRSFVLPEALVAVDQRVAEDGDLLDMAEDAADHQEVHVLVRLLQGDVDVQAAAAFPAQGFGQERGEQAAALGEDADDVLEQERVVRRFDRAGKAEVDFVLAGTAFMVAALGVEAHLLQSQADIAADVLAFVERGRLEVTAFVEGDAGRLSVLVPLEEVKLAFGSDGKGVAQLLRLGFGVLEQAAAVAGKAAAVGVLDVAEHADGPSLGGPPGHDGDGGGVGFEKKVRLVGVEESPDGRSVEADAIPERPLKLLAGDADVLHVAENVAERELDEPDILLLDEFQNGCFRVVHVTLLYE